MQPEKLCHFKVPLVLFLWSRSAHRSSLNAPGRGEIDRLGAEEAERRIDELDSGKVQAFPGEQVFAEIRKRLAK